jgi:hypothetical protein
MGKKPARVPDVATRVPNKKQPKWKEVSNHDNKPVWRFSTVDRSGPFAWPKGEEKELEIVVKLHDFDSMTWSDICGREHHQLSPQSLSRLAIEQLEKINKDHEAENLFSFHLAGKPRIIAIRHENVAKLLWYDPDHQVAPSKLKHT